MKRVFRLLICISCLLLATSFFSNTAFATEINLQEQQNLLMQKIQENQNILKQKKQEENKALLELKAINNNISKTTKSLQSTEKKLSTLEKELLQLEKELKESKLQIEANTKALEKNLRIIYEQGDVHFLEVLLDSTSITDFLTRWDLLNSIAKNNKEMIKANEEKLQLVKLKKELALQKQQKLDELKNDQKEKRKELSVASSRQQTIYNSLKSERAKIEAELDELERQSQQIANEIRRQTSGDNGEYQGSGKLAWPAPGYTRITSKYGMRFHPILKKNKMHTGMDIGAPKGANIVAAENGTVIQAGWNNAYGNMIVINHGGNLVTLYAHASKLLVSVGQQVTKGQVIAKVGSTGYSTGPHLHFEVRKNGDPVNPSSYL
ncbi:MAG: peptidoglycan DD-metalloendopeptidase family protein [Clostridia bacterium]|nr:peptidoglycan DD-metalloendopeptidase family protein [Clostridia bacterium]